MQPAIRIKRLFQALPYIEPTPLALWELKVAVLATTFIYAFFKFTWSIRQHSYCGILIASIPLPGNQEDKEKAAIYAERTTHLGNLAVRHFNDGLRAYYFALAELSWFIHPVIFILSTAWVVRVLYRREFHSKALEILTK